MNREIELYQPVVEKALPLWFNNATAQLLNVSENIMYCVDTDDGSRYVLRVHRQNNNIRAIKSELSWVNALQTDGVLRTPDVIPGRNGKTIQSVVNPANGSTLYLVMFALIEGREPNDSDDVLEQFYNLGELAARTHNHSMTWSPPADFERPAWNTNTLLGDNPLWGHWQDGPCVDKTNFATLQMLCNTVKQRLNNLGMDRSVYGLIHADMRRANLLIQDNATRLIDFDDCGFGWYLYDFATAVSFIEDHPQLPQLKSSWLEGYRKWRVPSELEIQELDTLIMLRRLALLAWMGGHAEVPIVQELQGKFASITSQLAQEYLATPNTDV